jgi:hypothetical protein
MEVSPVTIDWDALGEKVTAATRECNQGRKFVNTRDLAVYMNKEPDKYTLQSITRAIKHMGWKRFNNGNADRAGTGGKRASVFIVPWVADPVTEQAVNDPNIPISIL